MTTTSTKTRPAPAKKAPAKKPAARTTPPCISVPGRTFATALRRVAKFACTDTSLPMINAVRIECSKPGCITLVATDRFVLGAESIIADTEDLKTEKARAELGVTISLADVRVLLERLRTHMIGDLHIPLTVLADGRMSVLGTTLGIPNKDATPFPEWRKILHRVITDYTAGSKVSGSLINPDRVKPFLGLGREVKLHLPADPNRPIMAVIPGQFVGVLMPIRSEGFKPEETLAEFGIEVAA